MSITSSPAENRQYFMNYQVEVSSVFYGSLSMLMFEGIKTLKNQNALHRIYLLLNI